MQIAALDPSIEEDEEPAMASPQPIWNRSADWVDHWISGWSLFADYEPRTMYHDYIKLRDQLHTSDPDDWPWSSRKRLTGVLTVCVIALSWVLATPAFVFGILCGNWIIRCCPSPSTTAATCSYGLWVWFFRTVLLAYCGYYFLFPMGYSHSFHKWVSDLEIGRENGWKLLFQDASALREYKKPLLFLSHPHCVYQAAVGFLFVSSSAAREEAIPKVKFCVHWVLLWFVPLFKEFFRACGSIPADAKSIVKTLGTGHSVMLVPGGSEEVMWAGRTDAEHVVLKEKLGFIKLVLSRGLTVVPVWTFGESMGTGVIDVPFFDERLQFTKLTGLPLRFVSLCQRWFLPFPNGVLAVAVGRPLHLGHIASPSIEQLRAAHTQYVDSLLQLVKETKDEAGYPHIKVELV